MEWLIDNNGEQHTVQIERQGDQWIGRIGRHTERIQVMHADATALACLVDDHRIAHADVQWDGEICRLVIDHVPYEFVVSRQSSVVSKSSTRRPTTDDRKRSCDVKAPMPSRIVAIHVAPGDRVSAGQSLCVVEAMKMQNELHAPIAGTITTLSVTLGQAVEANQQLLHIEANAT